MITQVSLVISLVCLLFYLSGFLVTIRNDEDPNLCKMTYMFEYPQFTRISFRDNDAFPKYALYGYSEGHLTENARRNEWTGAPVLFIPGNSGSFKQARSLASVALRKGIANNWNAHLDYFAVDLNEEYSAFYGGVLEEQTEFVARCIVQVLELYRGLKNRPRQLILVGHSIGGKIAQSLLLHPEVTGAINSIITLASPMDHPAINLDMHIHKFYRNIDEQWQKNRSNKSEQAAKTKNKSNNDEESKAWDDKLLITIGGGSRDIQVHSGLTASPFSDVHAQATAIPNVWLTTDHRCSAWCKELVLVVNRFLYSILKQVPKGLAHGQGHQFVEEKKERLEKAKYYFTDERVDQDGRKEVSMVVDNRIGSWIEDTRRVYSVSLPDGVDKARTQMIRLMDFPQYKYLNVEAVNVTDEEQFVLGCAANDILDGVRYCPSATVISQNTTKLPSQDGERYYIQLDLHKIKAENPKWTHVILRLLPTEKPVQVNIDVNEGGGDRHILVNMPKWHSFSEQMIIEDTILGSSIYTMEVHGLEMAHQSLALNVKVKRCSNPKYHVVAKVSIPWAEGQEKYHYFTNSMPHRVLELNVPINKPAHLNGSENAVQVRLHLDPSCRYQVTARNSFFTTMARIVQIYSAWLPAHLVVVLCLAFRHQLQITPKNCEFKCYPLHKALINCGPFFIISGARLFVKMIMMVKVLPVPADYNHSIMVSLIIHGSSIALLSIGVAVLWAAMVFWGNVSYKVIFRIIRLPIPTLNVWMPLIEKMPMAVAVGLISMALVTNGGLALILACWVYFVLLTKMYEDFLEEFVYNTAKEIAMKLFGRFTRRKRMKQMPDPVAQALLDHEKELLATEDSSSAVAEADQTEEQKSESSLNKLLKETIAKQKSAKDQKNQEELKQRQEYESIKEGLSPLHFHFSLFLFLVLLTLMNLPSAITWAKNFDHVQRTVDASTVPAVMALAALAVIWQMKTPRSMAQGYPVLAMVFYGMSMIAVIYCLDSPFLLNNIIATMFVLVALHQLFAPKMIIPGLVEVDDDENDQDKEVEKTGDDEDQEDEDEDEEEEEEIEEQHMPKAVKRSKK